MTITWEVRTIQERVFCLSADQFIRSDIFRLAYQITSTAPTCGTSRTFSICLSTLQHRPPPAEEALSRKTSANLLVTFYLQDHSRPPTDKKNNIPPCCSWQHRPVSSPVSICPPACVFPCCSAAPVFPERNMQKRRKPEPIQLNPIPDGNTINGSGATEWVTAADSSDNADWWLLYWWTWLSLMYKDFCCKG